MVDKTRKTKKNTKGRPRGKPLDVQGPTLGEGQTMGKVDSIDSPKTPRSFDFSTLVDVVVETPSVQSRQAAVAPTLDDAFFALCRAVQYHLNDMPDFAKLAETRRMYAEGRTAGGWCHLMQLLEGVIGQPLRTG